MLICWLDEVCLSHYSTRSPVLISINHVSISSPQLLFRCWWNFVTFCSRFTCIQPSSSRLPDLMKRDKNTLPFFKSYWSLKTISDKSINQKMRSVLTYVSKKQHIHLSCSAGQWFSIRVTLWWCVDRIIDAHDTFCWYILITFCWNPCFYYKRFTKSFLLMS